jgi:hypothetical protein
MLAACDKGEMNLHELSAGGTWVLSAAALVQCGRRAQGAEIVPSLAATDVEHSLTERGAVVRSLSARGERRPIQPHFAKSASGSASSLM